MNFTIFWLQVLAGSWCPLSQVAGVPGLDTCYYTNVLILMITGECTNTNDTSIILDPAFTFSHVY